MLRIGFMLHAHELNLSSYQKSQNLCCIEIMKVTREYLSINFLNVDTLST